MIDGWWMAEHYRLEDIDGWTVMADVRASDR